MIQRAKFMVAICMDMISHWPPDFLMRELFSRVDMMLEPIARDVNEVDELIKS